MYKIYIIWSPNIVESRGNGIRVLHLLSSELNKRGYRAYMYTPKPYADGYDYVENITDDMRRSAIVVYPEVVTGNPLRFQNVVRYVLNKPGLLGGDQHYHKSEKIFVWDKRFLSGVPELLVPFIDNSIFYDNNSPKIQDCVFIYKKGKFRVIPELEKLTKITMKWPGKREELGKLLRSTGTLYSYDDCSAIINEAQVCGAKVKIITADSIVNAPSNDEMWQAVKLFDSRIDNFINITQKMDYRGELQEPVTKNRLIYCLLSLAKLTVHLLMGHLDKALAHKDRFLSMLKYGNYDVFH